MDLGIVVGMQIDKARRDNEIFGVDHLLPLGCIDAADLGNASAADADIAAISWQARAIDDRAVFDNRVVVRHKLSRSACKTNPNAALSAPDRSEGPPCAETLLTII